MNEITIAIEVAEIPKNWKSAKEARAEATSLRNTEFVALMDNIMEYINKVSKAGALSTEYLVAGGAYKEIYVRAQNTLRALGYTVEGNTDGGLNKRYWTIGW